MNKLISVFLLGTALSLTACGGDSDSSGSNFNSEESVFFQGLSNCPIEGNNIIVEEGGRGCLVKQSNINNGKKFSLDCRITGIASSPRGQLAEFEIRSPKDGDIEAVKRDIESANGKYDYTCKSLSDQMEDMRNS